MRCFGSISIRSFCPVRNVLKKQKYLHALGKEGINKVGLVAFERNEIRNIFVGMKE